MTRRRDLGPALAIAGAAIALASTIAGFVLVGGPGDTRDRRLDEMTMTELHEVAATARCAFVLEGKTFASMDEMRIAIGRLTNASPNGRVDCEMYAIDTVVSATEYSRISDDRIRLCATFRRPTQNSPPDQIDPTLRGAQWGYFPELAEARPAGRHCYDIQLVRPAPAG
jgi:hypothetical protein